MMAAVVRTLLIVGGFAFARGLPRLGVNGILGSLQDVGDPSALASDTRSSISRQEGVEELFFEQRLDHYDRQQLKTFRQRYFINRRHWAGPGSQAPIFLCVGGEGPPIEASVLSESVHCNDMVELGQREQALLIAIEHRYYGESNPDEDWATDSLRWLSSQQALADLSSFHDYIVENEGLSGTEKWVTWGGSYPGMLAGWARLKYPHLFHAAVSSSSPLQAQLDFPQYAEVMRDALATEGDGVGGSEACASAIETGHATIGKLLQTDTGRHELVRIFNLCEASSLDDEKARVSFAGDGVVVLPIQENDPACGGVACNIKAVCKIMTDKGRGSEVERLAALRKIQRNVSGQETDSCEHFPPASYSRPAEVVAGLLRPSSLLSMPDLGGAERGADPSNPHRAADPSNPDRAWLYQTCTEFGFYQTCEIGTRCPFTQGLHTLDLDLQMCQEAFGIAPDQVREQVRLTNLFYGGERPSGSRVIFPNGAVDPWHALGVLETPAPELPAIYVEGASHHFWTHPSKSTDSAEVVKAREIIWNQVVEWLAEED